MFRSLFSMVSFRGQFKLEPHPHWSPLGVNFNFPTSIPVTFNMGVPPPPPSRGFNFHAYKQERNHSCVAVLHVALHNKFKKAYCLRCNETSYFSCCCDESTFFFSLIWWTIPRSRRMANSSSLVGFVTFFLMSLILFAVELLENLILLSFKCWNFWKEGGA